MEYVKWMEEVKNNMEAHCITPISQWYKVGKSKHNKTLLRCKESLHLNKVLLCFDLSTLYHCDIVIAQNGDEPSKDCITPS